MPEFPIVDLTQTVTAQPLEEHQHPLVDVTMARQSADGQRMEQTGVYRVPLPIARRFRLNALDAGWMVNVRAVS